MCEYGDTLTMSLKIPAELSHTGKDYYKPVGIDRCIASLIKALNDGGIETVASCCGHKKITGNIALADGRILEIFPDFNTWKKHCPVHL